MIAFERIVLLALHELPDVEAVEVEDHVVRCTECAATLERLLDVGERVATLTRTGQVYLLAGTGLIRVLERERMITRNYRMPPGGQVFCTVDASDIYTAMHLGLDTRGVRRLDLVYEAASGGWRIEDFPFDPAEPEIVFALPGSYLRTLPSERKTIKAVAVDQGSERVIAEYVLNHTAFSPPK
jgi:hypothetical protein